MIERKIHMLWVTARPNVFKKTQAEWLSKAKNPKDVTTKVAVDNVWDASFLDGYDVLVTNPPRKGVAFPAYCLTTTFSIPSLNDIIILASDDFYPPDQWDVFINQEMEQRRCLLVNDGVVKLDANVVTIPIMDGYAFMALNRILYHKAYRHMFSDAELYQNCNELGLIKNIRDKDVVFQHKHYTHKTREKDSLDYHNQKKFYIDKKIFNYRMRKSLKFRIKI